MTEIIDYVVMIIPVEEEPYAAIWHLPRGDSPRYWAALKAQVEQITGDPMEHVRVFADFHGGQKARYLDMFVNELGHLKGMELNAVATAIYHNNVRVHQPDKAKEDMMPVVGPAVLFEERVWR